MDDLPPGPGLVYRVDPVTGEISFGNFHPSRPDGTRTGPARRPAADPGGRTATSRGRAGNVARGQVTVLGTTRDWCPARGRHRGHNLGPGQDGTDEEPVEDTLRRAPEELKIRDRAVTADDYEFLAREASNEVLIQRCLTPRLDWRTETRGLRRDHPRSRERSTSSSCRTRVTAVPRPEPTPDRIRQVRGYLEPRRDLTASLAVLGPAVPAGERHVEIWWSGSRR